MDSLQGSSVFVKEFIPYEEIRNSSIKLSYTIYRSGYHPDVIYALLRGGAYLANILSEYFQIVLGDKKVYYAAVVAHSYTSFSQGKEINLEGWTLDPRLLKEGTKVLLIDDIFDSGRTLNFLAQTLLKESKVRREDIKIAVLDYKLRQDSKDLDFLPDYYAHAIKPQIGINGEEIFSWRHYLSHELVSMTPSEVSHFFPTQGDDCLREALEELFVKRK